MKLMKLSTVSLDEELSFDEADFFVKINTKVFYNLIVSLWVCVTRHVQIAQITSAQYLCSILKKKVKGEVDFLPADKYQKFIHVNDIILNVCSQTCPIYSK